MDPISQGVVGAVAAVSLAKNRESVRLAGVTGWIGGLNSALTLEDGSKPARLRDLPGARVFHVQLADAPKSR
ncbi:MAG: hypothetical protein AAF585_27960, partial [Verrucomicrobiota bacterium]